MSLQCWLPAHWYEATYKLHLCRFTPTSFGIFGQKYMNRITWMSYMFRHQPRMHNYTQSDCEHTQASWSAHLCSTVYNSNTVCALVYCNQNKLSLARLSQVYDCMYPDHVGTHTCSVPKLGQWCRQINSWPYLRIRSQRWIVGLRLLYCTTL